MGIMPADRELKWQRVFRRFGLPGEDSGGADKANEKTENRRESGDTRDDKSRDRKPGKK